ncbi:unnamed protein product [Closterium sp. NIES-64]|nr:unnamed protein product [Closterium sp. NIES-64]
MANAAKAAAAAASVVAATAAVTGLLLGGLSAALVLSWLVSGHWLLNNALGAAICVAFVSHVRLPNVKVCALLLACLFLYDIFWVFFSHRFFGANVMLSVATQHAHNPAHSVAHSLHLPSAVAKSIVREIELPVKLLFPRDLFGELNIFGRQERGRARDFMVLGLGDMAIPGMLLALVLCVDQHKRRQQQEEQQERELEVLEAGKGGQEQHQEPPGPSHSQNSQEHSEQHSQQQQHSQGSLSRPLLDSSPSARERGSGQLGYVWVAALGYAVGLVAALAAGVLTRSPQPALLYLVPSTLGPVSLVAWSRGELADLWDGSPGLMPFDRDKLETLDV